MGQPALDSATGFGERRHEARRTPAGQEPLARIRLRTGRDVAVVNVAHTGVLVEGPVRLLPGTHVDAHVVTRSGRMLVRTRVVRAWVAGLESDGVRYRSALAFAQRVDTAPAGYALPDILTAGTSDAGMSYPPDSAVSDQPGEERLSA